MLPMVPPRQIRVVGLLCRQTHCSWSPGPIFQEGCGTWEKWNICGMLCGRVGGTGRCHHRTLCEGFSCQLFHYPATGRKPGTYTHAGSVHCSVKYRLGPLLSVGTSWSPPVCSWKGKCCLVSSRGQALSQVPSYTGFPRVVSEVTLSCHIL